jgi:hypothetical protein
MGKGFQVGEGEESEDDNVNQKASIVIEHLIQALDVSHTSTIQHWRVYSEMYKAYKEGQRRDWLFRLLHHAVFLMCLVTVPHLCDEESSRMGTERQSHQFLRREVDQDIDSVVCMNLRHRCDQL